MGTWIYQGILNFVKVKLTCFMGISQVTNGDGNGNPLQYSCLVKPHGQRSLAVYDPLGRRESDMT